MTSGWNASSWHRHYLYPAALRSFDSVLLFSDKPFANIRRFSPLRMTKCAAPPFLISHFSFNRGFQPQSRGSTPYGPPPFPIKRRCEITIISFSRSICRGGLAALIGVTGKPYPRCLSYHSHPIRPFRAPSPRGEGCDTRIPSSKKRRRSRHLNLEP